MGAVTARSNVPVFIEIGTSCLKDKKYEIKSIRGNMVDIIDEYGDTDSFSVDGKYRGTNFLWDWFLF